MSENEMTEHEMTEDEMTEDEMTEHEPMDDATETMAEAPEPVPPPVHYPPPRRPTAGSAPPRQTPSEQGTVRNPLLAAFFSFFPGLGNVYNGFYMRGVTFFLVFFGLIGLATQSDEPESILLVFGVIFTWFFNVFDAYRQATMINYGYNPVDELPSKARTSTWGSGSIVGGVTVFLLGLYGFLHDRWDIDLSLLVDYWYLLFMAFGAFLIAQAFLEKRKAEEAEL